MNAIPRAPTMGYAAATVPAEPFVAPVILHASAPRVLAGQRDAVLTAMLWGGWLYLLVAAVGCVWMPPFVQALLPVAAPDAAWPSVSIVLSCLVAGVLTTALVLGRALRDRRR